MMVYTHAVVPDPGMFDRLLPLIADLRPKDIAKACGIKRQAVYQWKKRKTEPDKKNWVALAKLLDVNMFWLFFGCGEKAGTTLDTEELEIFLKIRRLKPEYRTLLNRTVDSWLDDRAVPDPTRRAAG